MIGLVFGGIAVAASVIFSAAGQSVNKDLQRELEGIVEKSREEIECTQQIVDKTNSKLLKSYDALKKQRNKIYDTTFKTAEEMTEKIRIARKKRGYKNVLPEIEMKPIKIRRSKKILDYPYFASFDEISIALATLTLGPVGTIAQSVKLQYDIDDALLNKEEISAECEMIKLECDKMKIIIKTMNDTKRIINELNKLAVKSEETVQIIFDKKGYNPKRWSKKDTDSIRTMFNVLKTLSVVMNAEILTPTGRISKKQQKLVCEAKEIISEV